MNFVYILGWFWAAFAIWILFYDETSDSTVRFTGAIVASNIWFAASHVITTITIAAGGK